MTKHGKQYTEIAKLVDQNKVYQPEEAVSLVKKTSFAKFDATVELHLRMGVDPRHADQQVRAVAALPNGLGKQVTVVVFAQGEAARIAEEAGADVVGADDLIKRIEEGWIDFDVALATPDMMGRGVSKLGRILGRRGLMPNPKSGTIAQGQDLPRAIASAKQGRVEFRVDKTALIHVPIGKVSFEDDKLMENLAALIDAIQKAKPTGAKGQYIRTITITSSMGPGVKLDLQPTLALGQVA
jgi:large subunit ribosomal protein L1